MHIHWGNVHYGWSRSRSRAWFLLPRRENTSTTTTDETKKKHWRHRKRDFGYCHGWKDKCCIFQIRWSWVILHNPAFIDIHDIEKGTLFYKIEQECTSYLHSITTSEFNWKINEGLFHIQYVLWNVCFRSRNKFIENLLKRSRFTIFSAPRVIFEWIVHQSSMKVPQELAADLS